MTAYGVKCVQIFSLLFTWLQIVPHNTVFQILNIMIVNHTENDKSLYK